VHWFVIGLALASAFASAMSTTLKKAAANRSARSHTASTRLAGLGGPLWFAGLGFDVIGVGLQVVALHYGALALVQPLLVSGLIFALILRHVGSSSRVSGRELLWAGVLVGCLVGFLFFSGATTGGNPAQAADQGAAAVTGIAILAAIVACMVLARRTIPPTGRAALLGVAVGAVYALTAALIKAASDVFAAHGVVALVRSWQLYVLLLMGAAGQWLTQRAFQAGPITSSLPAISTVDPLLSVLIGVLVYHEVLHRGPWGGLLLLALLLLLVAAVIQLGRVESEESATVAESPETSEPGVIPGG
jgi:drug/metabolite transporter (DMT)-like permease